MSILKHSARALNQLPLGTSRSVNTSVPDFEHHTRDKTVSQKTPVSSVSVILPLLPNPLPLISLQHCLILATDNVIQYNTYILSLSLCF